MSLTKVTNSMIKGAVYYAIDFGADSSGAQDSTVAIQNAIDAAFNAGGGSVCLSDGEFLVSSVLTVKQGVAFIMEKGTILNHNSTSNSVFELQKNTALVGVQSKVNLTNTSWNGKAVIVDGAQQIDFIDTVLIDGILFEAQLVSRGHTTTGSIGLYVFANGNQNYVSGLKVSNCTFRSFEKGIVLDSILGTGVIGDSSTWRWVNGNVFENIFIYECDYSFKLLGNNGVPNAVDGNLFINFVVQVYGTTVQQIAEVNGNSNEFTGYVWDFPETTKTAVKFGTDVYGTNSYANTWQSNLDIDRMAGVTPLSARTIRYNNIFSQLDISAGYLFVGPNTVAYPINGPDFGDCVRAIAREDSIVSWTAADANVGSCFNGNRDTAGSLIYFTKNSGDVELGKITTDLNTVTYSTTSDYRLKENPQPMQNALLSVEKLNPVTYTWKSDGSKGQGFIAHELQEIIPEAVIGKKDETQEIGTIKDCNGNVLRENVAKPIAFSNGETWEKTGEKPIYQSIDTSFIVATLVKAIQELKSEIDELKGAK